MAPEISKILAANEYSKKAEDRSLGCVLYPLIAGVAPFLDEDRRPGETAPTVRWWHHRGGAGCPVQAFVAGC
jgi:serine/threonine protein kinase